jgi:hypothetical protein
LRHNRVGASGSDIVDFVAQKDDIPVDRTSIESSYVCDVHDIEVVKNLVDALFPRGTGFGASLKGVEYWWYQGAVNFHSMARAITVSVGVINPSVCRLVRRRDVGISFSAVCAHHGETQR